MMKLFRTNSLRRSTLVVGMVSCALFFLSCAEDKKVETDKESANGETGLNQIDPRPKVSMFELDEPTFRVSGVRVGRQSYMGSESPAVFFMLPQSDLVDYVEIMRCNGDEILNSGTGSSTLENVDLGTSSGAEETQILQSSNFWQNAETKSGCYIVATDYMIRDVFLDNAAPSGDYRYLIRGCVDPSRLSDTENLSTRSCSKQVTVSPVFKDYVNNRIDEEREVMAEANNDRAEIDSLGRQIYYKTIEFNNGLADCVQREGERIADVTRRRSITQLIGLGVSFAASIYTTGFADGASWSSEWSSNWSAVWEQRNATAGLGVNLGNALFNITSTSSDYPRSCTRAQKADRDRKLLVQKLKETHRMFEDKMKRAQTYKARREGVEKAQ